MASTLIVLATGLAGAYTSRRLNLPAGVLLGMITGTVVALLLLGFPSVAAPSGTGEVLEVLIGVFVGLRVSKESAAAGKRALPMSLLVAAALGVGGLLSACIVGHLTAVELRTALFAAAPGGITEMSAVAASLGASGATVTAVHLVRLLVAVVLANGVIALTPRLRGEEKNSGAIPDSRVSTDSVRSPDAGRPNGANWAILAPFSGAICGTLGLLVSVPGGGILGALLGTSAVTLWHGAPTVKGFRSLVQLLAGLVIGLRVSPEFLDRLPQLIIAGLIIVCFQLLLWPMIWLLLRRVGGYDEKTALFASAPGGMAEIVSSAEAHNADVVVVSVMHVVRLTVTIAIFPYIALFLTE